MNDSPPDDLRRKIDALPRDLPPGRDLWPEIQAEVERLDPKVLSAPQPNTLRSTRSTFRRWRMPLAIAAALALAAGLTWLRPPSPAGVWPVSPLAGTPRLGSDALLEPSRLAVGQWLETDATSSARLAVGSIGEVQLQPNSRLRLVNADATDHRLELARGTMSALIWAPPRLFFVETPGATAIDLGCAYTLTVDDDGDGTLHVTSGYVALQDHDREALIPAGLTCLTRRGAGPGTPFAPAAPAALKAALERFDFAQGGEPALAEILAQARPGDEVMLWHLLARATPAQRAGVYDKLAALHAPPAGVTREGILAGHAAMRLRWAEELGLAPGLFSRGF